MDDLRESDLTKLKHFLSLLLIQNRYAYSNEDIEGTKSSTKKQGIQTNRSLNPLQPKYQFPGRSESDNAYGGFVFS